MKTQFLIVIFFFTIISCSNKKTDSGLELSDEQLNELIKNQKPVNSNQSAMALDNLESDYQKDSSNIENVYNLSFMYCSKCLNDSSFNICPKAIQYLNRVVKLNPEYREGKAFYNRQLCAMHLGKYEAALEDINSFIELNKKNPKPAVNYFLQKAIILEKIGKIDEACKTLNLAKNIDTVGFSNLNWKISCK